MRSYLPYIKTMLYAGSATILAISFMVFPKEAYEASIRGLSMWWDVVFPSLLPFFIISEFLIRFGVVSFIGALFEPIMRPLFRVPGSGGFVWAMGLASGFPAGAKLTARLRQEKKITAIEGERLVSFTNASNPLFIFGAIAVGFFHNPALGVVLAASHYGGNFLVGIAMRYYGRDQDSKEKDSKFSIAHAISLMHSERLNDQRPLGKMMGDAVQSAIQTLLMIGGFIILFSVLNQILTLIQISFLFTFVITIILGFLQMPNELSAPIVSGLFEITLGSQMITETFEATLYEQVIIVSFILAFNGFSVQAQVASILADTDIRFRPFFFARCLHGFLSAGICALIFHRLYPHGAESESVIFMPHLTESTISSLMIIIYNWLITWGGVITLISLVSYICLLSYKTLNKLEKNP
ncbi:sporulation integral membrane protein YlbJ [Bacillus shivajii]|uniref:sporulation integral membrane protein YlbJ n=1 Tax=Bacillus shivajii TaxID=1983719 RepID=UPI001CF96729|nr:sporulation integral membrane protein YlbJ [Bacillus shivajii]UCZ51846.1 sporulation integral membrane protein YlbJ [Bacillus shivajii]